MFKAFAAAAIIGCTSALKSQVQDIYGNPFNHPNEEVKTPTCTLKVHSVLPDLDVPKVPIKAISKKNGYDPYGYQGLDSGSTSSGDMDSGSTSSVDMDSSDKMDSPDKMDSSAMMSEMMGGMQEGNNMMSSAMQETRTYQSKNWDPKAFNSNNAFAGLGFDSAFGKSSGETKDDQKSIADLVNEAIKTSTDDIPASPYEPIESIYEEPKPVDPNAPKLTKEEWFALRKKRYLTHEEYALYKLGFIKTETPKPDESAKKDDMMSSDQMSSGDMMSSD